MKRRLALTGLLFAAVTALCSMQATGEGAWTTLLDGKNLDHFTMVGDANWRIEDSAAVADKGNGFLLTKETYGDFELRAEFWVGPDANSGIFIRATNPTTINSKTAYEVNIWDERPEKDYASGAIVGLAKVDPMPKTVGQWNTYEIIAKGTKFTVKLNGKTTVDNVEDMKLKLMKGQIALQHGLGLKNASGVVNDKGVVKFRKIEIRPL